MVKLHRGSARRRWWQLVSVVVAAGSVPLSAHLIAWHGAPRFEIDLEHATSDTITLPVAGVVAFLVSHGVDVDSTRVEWRRASECLRQPSDTMCVEPAITVHRRTRPRGRAIEVPIPVADPEGSFVIDVRTWGRRGRGEGALTISERRRLMARPDTLSRD